MYERQTRIVNKIGLHARPAANFVTEAKKYASKITITNLETGKSADAKSMIRLLTLALTYNTRVSICAEGNDQIEAVNNLTAFIDSGAGEKE